MNVDLAVVLDEAQFPEFVHKIDPGPRCPIISANISCDTLGRTLSEASRACHSAPASAACAPGVSRWS